MKSKIIVSILGFLALVGVLSVVGATSEESAGRELPALEQPLTEPTHGDAAPVAADPGGSVPAGMYLVGTDIPAGTYRTTGPEDSAIPWCYWERLANASGEFDAIIANNGGEGPMSVTVDEGEYFSTNGCAPWVIA